LVKESQEPRAKPTVAHQVQHRWSWQLSIAISEKPARPAFTQLEF